MTTIPGDASTTQDGLFFIPPTVLNRLVEGLFVPQRKQSKAYPMRDRRQSLSTLNVTRRAIRYEPQVFLNRKDELVASAQVLNNEQIKLLMVSGPPGRGKTSFVRGLAEMMDGSKQQLLWFDVSRHTDFDEVVRFLVEYMTMVCRNLSETPESASEPADPIKTLEHLLNQADDFPILIVIDNAEHLVSSDKTMRSRELKEAFNFLLSFPNIKLVLSGRQVPVTDMNPASRAVHHLELPPLNAEASLALLHQLIKDPEKKSEALLELTPHLEGEPYYLFLFAKLYGVSTEPSEQWLKRLSSEPAGNLGGVLLNCLLTLLTEPERRLLSLFGMLRHGLTPGGMSLLTTYCDPSLETFDWRVLDQLPVRWALKKVYPPQMVLEKLERRHNEESETQENIEPYYQVFESFQDILVAQLPVAEQIRYHEALSQFYLSEKNKHFPSASMWRAADTWLPSRNITQDA